MAVEATAFLGLTPSQSELLLADSFARTRLVLSVAEFPGGQHLVVNDAFCEATGFQRDEVLGRTTVELGILSPAFRQQLIAEVSAKGSVSALEFDIRRKDGGTRRLRYWADVVETPGRRLLLVMAEDCTAQKALEHELHESRALLAKAFGTSPLMMTIASMPDGRFVEVNDEFLRVTGYARDEVLGKTSLDLGLVAEEDRQRPIDRLRTGEPVRGVEAAYLTRTGGRRRVRFWTERLEGPGGPRVLTVADDITERQRVADEAEANRRLFAAAFSTSPLMMSISTVPEGRFLEVNEQFRRLSGFSREELLGHTSVELGMLSAEDHGRLREGLRTGGAVRGLDLSVREKGGGRRLVRFWAEQISAPDGARLLTIADDMTDRSRLEASLAQSERLATMGMLAAGVAHEINNPLAYVLSNLELLSQELPRLVGLTRRGLSALRAQQGEGAVAQVLQEPDGAQGPLQLDELLDSAAAALEGVRRIRRISRGLGSFSRVEQGEREAVDVNAALEAAATMAHNELKFRAVLVKDLGDVPRVIASEGKLAQVFLNLVINAAHAIPEGHVADHRVTLRSWAADGHVFVEVADTGSGISKEHLERAFEPFFTTKPRGIGSGLGLAISRAILSDFGGDIRLESELGRGTRALVQLPAMRAAVEAPHPAAPPAGTADAATHGRVLVVDDEAAIRRSVMRVLGRQHEVVEAASGRDARRLLEHDQAFDAVLCDLMMPEMTGMELHAWCAAAHPALAARFIFISGGAFTPNAADYLARVTVPKLEKPFDHATLRALVAARVR